MAAIISALLGGLLSVWAFNESRLPYNEAGRYFDSVEMVVRHQQDPLGLTMVAAAFFATAFLLHWLGSRFKSAGITGNSLLEKVK